MVEGEPSQCSADVVGQPHHGQPGKPGAGYRTTSRSEGLGREGGEQKAVMAVREAG